MLSFSAYLQLSEELKGIPGENAGFEEIHEFPGDHKVYVNIKHHGEGHHKVTALYIPPGGKKGTVSRKGKDEIPEEIRVAAVHKTFGTVKNFMKTKQWNSVILGGSDTKNMVLYRQVGSSMAKASNGQLSSQNIVGAGVRIVRNKPIENPVSSGSVPKPTVDTGANYRDQVGKGSGSGASGRSSGESIDASGFGTKFGPSGFKKKKTHDGVASIEVSGASSAASSIAN